MNLNRVKVAVLSLAGLTLLVGCTGGGDDTATPTAPVTPTTVPRPATTTTVDPPGPAQCDNVFFDGGGENAAGSITAWGVPCDEAVPFVRRVGVSMGAENGLSTIDAEGYHCERTGQEDFGLPSSTYECTNGAKRITLVRT